MSFNYIPVTNTIKLNDFFQSSGKEPLLIVQGSQGASKTVSILMLIIDAFRENPSLEITIASAEKTKLMDTAFQDLKKICIDWNIWEAFKWNDNKSKLSDKNSLSGFIEFIGLDKEDLGKGRRRDIIYINEVNKVKQKKTFDISQRAKKVIVDFNADKRFYIHELINKNNFIQLTFEGNEKISPEERRNILSYKERGYNPDGTIKSEFYANKWRVYGLGDIGGVEGRIYYWNRCSNEEYFNIEAEEFIGVDWWKVDPFAIVGVKYQDGKIFINEYNYFSENQLQTRIGTNAINGETGSIPVYMFKKLGISEDSTIICDNNRPLKIRALRTSGWENTVAIGNKVKIIERIAMMQELDVYYTETSNNVEMEQFDSCWRKDRAGNSLEEREDLNNHTLDAIEYVVLYLKSLNKF